ncbi:MAG: hypothetical protein AAF266_05510 [Planctomycetota bacterium]
MSKRSDTEFERLVALACDDLLEPSDHAKLAAMLGQEASARQAYLEAMLTERLLEVEHEDSLLSVAQAKQLVAGPHKPPVAAALEKASKTLQRGAQSPRLLALFAVAASLLVATLSVQVFTWVSYDPTVMQAQRPTLAEAMAVGRVVDLDAARWADDTLDGDSEVVGGQRIRLLTCTAELQLNNGAVVKFAGPADLQIVSTTLVNAYSGAYCATSAAVDEEFVIQTPTTQVVNVGPDLSPVGGGPAGVGVDVRDGGATEVVVFDGEVALQMMDDPPVGLKKSPTRPISFADRRTVRHLGMGEALRVGHAGKVQRIMSVDSRRFPQAVMNPLREDNAVIRSIADESRDPAGLHYYRIVPGGFEEDARAFVDRFHQWNGIEGRGIPAELVGADYVMAFNNDKWAQDIRLQIELSAPATVYVLMDERVPPPRWLSERFTRTGMQVGLDEGWHAPDGRAATLSPSGTLLPITARLDGAQSLDAQGLSNQSPYQTGVGPGDSVDATYRVWKQQVAAAGRVEFGSPGQPHERTSMYGIAAVRTDAATDGVTP